MSTRSPIKDPPLPEPGDSLHRRLRAVLDEQVILWAIMVVVSGVWAAMEWIVYLTGIRVSPFVATAAFGVVFLIASLRIRTARRELKAIRQGLLGERAVGQILDDLRSNGYQVFHDIEESGYNIDHALIGPTGVYAIETKTLSKPNDRDAQITYDGQMVYVEGMALDRDPIRQAIAVSERVAQILRERTGQAVSVRPVVLFPGWFINRKCRNERVWVLNPLALGKWLAQEDLNLSEDQVRRLSLALRDHLRSRTVGHRPE